MEKFFIVIEHDADAKTVEVKSLAFVPADQLEHAKHGVIADLTAHLLAEAGVWLEAHMGAEAKLSGSFIQPAKVTLN